MLCGKNNPTEGMHGGIVMTMNEKERGMKCGRIHRNRRVMLPIPAFMLFVHGFYYACGNCGGDNAVPVVGAASG